MTLQVPAGFGQAAIELRANGDPDPWYTTFGVDLSGVGGDNTEAARSILLNFQAAWLPHTADFVEITACDLAVGQDGGTPLHVRFEDPVSGEGTAAQLPQNCALLVHKASARGGHRGRGRMYIPGQLQEAKVNGIGLIDGAERTALQTSASDFLTFLADDGLLLPTPMVILHNDGGTTPAGAPDPVTGLFVDGLIATQRGRLRR